MPRSLIHSRDFSDSYAALNRAPMSGVSEREPESVSEPFQNNSCPRFVGPALQLVSAEGLLRAVCSWRNCFWDRAGVLVANSESMV